MKFHVLPVAPLGANCVLIVNDNSELIIVDPGGEPEKILSYIDEYTLEPKKIFCTHGHFDHVGAINDLVLRYKIPVYIHSQDNALLSQASSTAKYFGLPPISAPVASDFFKGGEIFPFGEDDIHVIHTPGHTPGGVCFYMPKSKVVITGDTLFANSVGRTDLAGGNYNALENSILTKLYTLPDDVAVCPGHGPDTTIGREKKQNPYVKGN